jgi:hypothetical protein
MPRLAAARILSMLREISKLSFMRAAAVVSSAAIVLNVFAPSVDAAATKAARHPLPDRIAHHAKQVANQMDTVGWCFAGVKQALRAVGVALEGAAAWMAADQLKQDRRFNVVAQRELRRGDILVHGKSPTHPYGHIAVYLGNGSEASDHVQHIVLGGTYGRTVVFRAKGGNSKSIVADKTVVAARRATAASSRAVVASRPTNTNPASPAAATVYSLKPVDPQVVAAARSEAAKFAYLYSQGAVSRKDAESRIAHVKELETHSSSAVASNRHPAERSPDA